MALISILFCRKVARNRRARRGYAERSIQLFGLSENLEDLTLLAKGAELRGAKWN